MADDWKKRCDNNHVGHFFVDYMRKRGNDICQIDAATGQEETCASVLSRSIRLAQIFGKLGLVPGDPIVIAGWNHLDVHIPFYAGLISGVPVAGIDPALKRSELKSFLNIVKPKIAFCEYAMLEEYENAVQELRLDTKIVTFGGGENSFSKFMNDQEEEDDFQVAIFNTDKVYCWLPSSSGSTGRPKVIAITHQHVLHMRHRLDYPEANGGPPKRALNLSTLHWMTGKLNALLMPITNVKVQTSAPATTEHVIDIINKYKPAWIGCTPTFLAPVLHSDKHCDLTCCDILGMGGSNIQNELLNGVKARVRADTAISLRYGMTELGIVMQEAYSEESVALMPFPEYEVKLISPETGREILEPNVTGELLARGPRMACYYDNPEETDNLFTEDGFAKSGDLFYKDDQGRYIFVDRLKMLLKYNNYQIVPVEVEEVIMTHGGVADVCVTGVPHPDHGDLVVACVVRKPGHHVTADEIKELVARQFSASKHLHGGVVFLDALPTTGTGKVARLEVKKLAITAHRE